jgi:phosphoserine phosphatase
MTEKQKAAFFRAEGIVVSRGVVAAAVYMAGNRAGFRERAFRLGQAALAAPVFAVLGQNDRVLGNRVAHLALRDMSEDRISVLSEEYVADILRDKVLETGVDLMKRARGEGRRVVVLAEGIGHIMRPLAEDLRVIDDMVCNELEFRDGRATGKLLDPVIGGYEGGRWLEDYAEEHDIDLAGSVAYASHGPDLLLLSAVGSPCAVNPDLTLRKAAREADWPVIDFRA